jgi:hypothetical protein
MDPNSRVKNPKRIQSARVKNPKRIQNGFWTLQGGSDRLFRNAGKELLLLAA